jgi:GTP-binding protein EngB required for normal cell division
MVSEPVIIIIRNRIGITIKAVIEIHTNDWTNLFDILTKRDKILKTRKIDAVDPIAKRISSEFKYIIKEPTKKETENI